MLASGSWGDNALNLPTWRQQIWPLVIDEAHRAIGGYAYVEIVGLVLGLHRGEVDEF